MEGIHHWRGQWAAVISLMSGDEYDDEHDLRQDLCASARSNRGSSPHLASGSARTELAFAEPLRRELVSSRGWERSALATAWSRGFR